MSVLLHLVDILKVRCRIIYIMTKSSYIYLEKESMMKV